MKLEGLSWGFRGGSGSIRGSWDLCALCIPVFICVVGICVIQACLLLVGLCSRPGVCGVEGEQ